MSEPRLQAGVESADRARAELYDTLGQLRERLDYAQRIDNSMSRAKRRVTEQKTENPLGFIAGVASVAVVAGLAAWGVARVVLRAFDGDR